jgi:hypothetical protein
LFLIQQVEDYADRKGMELSTVERWLEVNLAYSNNDTDED